MRARTSTLGVVLFRLATGHLPFETDAGPMVLRHQLFSPVPPPSWLDESIDPQIEALILNATRKHPDNRYPTMSALAEDLDAILDGSGRVVQTRPLVRTPDVYVPTSDRGREALRVLSQSSDLTPRYRRRREVAPVARVRARRVRAARVRLWRRTAGLVSHRSTSRPLRTRRAHEGVGTLLPHAAARSAHAARRHPRHAVRRGGEGSVSLARIRQRSRGHELDRAAERVARAHAGASARQGRAREAADRVARDRLDLLPHVKRSASGTLRLFYTRREGKQNHPILYVRDGLDGRERVLVDPNALGGDEHTTALDWYAPSEEGRYLAYGTSEHGSEDSVLKILDVEQGRELSDVIPQTRHASIAWLPGGRRFFCALSRSGQRARGRRAIPPQGLRARARAALRRRSARVRRRARSHRVPERERVPDGRYLAVTVSRGWSESVIHLKDLGSRARAPCA